MKWLQECNLLNVDLSHPDLGWLFHSLESGWKVIGE